MDQGRSKERIKMVSICIWDCSAAGYNGVRVHTEWTERIYHPPPEWSWVTRNQWKMAKIALGRRSRSQSNG